MAKSCELKSKSINVIHTKVLIVGGGSAGMSSAFNLKIKDIILVEAPGSNSILSAWNIMVKPREQLKQEIMKSGNNMSDVKLLKKFIETKEAVIDDLKFLGIKFRKSNIGLVPDYPLPGLEIKKVLSKYIVQKGIKKITGYVREFLIDNKKNIKGVSVDISETKTIIITFDYLILAAGGMSSFFNFSTGEKKVTGSILALCHEVGLTITNIEFLMFHPFLIIDKRLPRVLMSGDILTQLKFKDSKNKRFLSKKIENALKHNEHHGVFPEMVREFYQQSLRGKVLAKLICSSDWFEKYKKENEFGFIFKGWTKDKLGDIEITPAFHFSIGGLKINDRAETSQDHVYAAGEITGGLYGSNRIGGMAIAEAWTFGKIAAKEINKQTSKIDKVSKPIDIESLKVIKSRELGDQLKKKLWQALGPVKNKIKLKELEVYLKKKKKLSPEENLIKNLVQVSLSRQESIGSFYRADLLFVNTAKSSCIVDNKILFK